MSVDNIVSKIYIAVQPVWDIDSCKKSELYARMVKMNEAIDAKTDDNEILAQYRSELVKTISASVIKDALPSMSFTEFQQVIAVQTRDILLYLSAKLNK